MNSLNPRVIHERSTILSIPPTSPTSKGVHLEKQYSLKTNFFDPTKCSPPNEFMLKLQLRMSLYNTDINDNKRIKE